jgi:hypothetical protein
MVNTVPALVACDGLRRRIHLGQTEMKQQLLRGVCARFAAMGIGCALIKETQEASRGCLDRLINLITTSLTNLDRGITSYDAIWDA